MKREREREAKILKHSKTRAIDFNIINNPHIWCFQFSLSRWSSRRRSRRCSQDRCSWRCPSRCPCRRRRGCCRGDARGGWCSWCPGGGGWCNRSRWGRRRAERAGRRGGRRRHRCTWAMRPKPQRHRQIRQRRQLIWRTRTRMALEKNLQMARRMSRRHLQKSPRHGGLVIKGNSHLDELFEIVWVLSLVTWDTHTHIYIYDIIIISIPSRTARAVFSLSVKDPVCTSN